MLLASIGRRPPAWAVVTEAKANAVAISMLRIDMVISFWAATERAAATEIAIVLITAGYAFLAFRRVVYLSELWSSCRTARCSIEMTEKRRRTWRGLLGS